MKKVSVIVPVHNSEQYLGYCVNSILSQTYTNIEVILINDGSTDSSLRICNNYAAIDRRIKVIDVENGGVSKARNLGLKYATGEFVQFVDSDDVISLNMTERLVKAIEAYKTDIVFCGMKLVSLKDFIPIQMVYCTSEGIGKECVLDQKTFLQKMVFLLWKTAMLEGPCNRIYRMSIIKAHNIRFPENISLGEDLLMNLRYYDFCNGVALLSDKLYYYIQSNDSSLTKVYREDFFNNQMMLIDSIRTFLKKKLTVLSKEEEICLSEYTVAKAIQCVQHLFQSENQLDEIDIKASIAEIVNDKRVRAAIKQSNYIEHKYEWIRWLSEFSDVGAIYEILKNMKGQELADSCSEASGINNMATKKTPGVMNRSLVWCLNKILRIKNIRALEMIRNSLIDFGLKKTIVKTFNYLKRTPGKERKID